ncbi:MAG: XrtA/PEP-CTERM system histidine kinase PrsK, partial [Thermodesulfobacteriota bacterium]
MNLNSILAYIAALASLVTATVVIYRDPQSFVHRIFTAGMCVLAFEAVLTGLECGSTSIPEVMFWQRLKFVPLSLLPGIWLPFSLSFARANYFEFLNRWKWVIGVSFLLPLSFLTLFYESLLVGGPFLDESLRLLFRVGWPGYVIYLLCLVGTVLILMNLERTFRHSVGHTRWQVKFMILGIGCIFGGRIYMESQVILFRLVDVSLEIVDIGILILANVLIALSFWRVKLLKFDFYLSHSFLYNSFTVLLVGVYFIAVGLVAKLIFFLKGSQDPAITALFVFVAVLVVAVFLLSDRLRLVRKRLVSRYFRRPRYDYSRVWAQFTERTASLTGMKDLCRNIVRMVSETLETLSVSIWLIDEREEHLFLGGSTSFSGKAAENLKITGESAGAVIRAMGQLAYPVDLGESTDEWIGTLRTIHGEALHEARIDLCVPLRAASNLVGILTLAEKVSSEPFSFEDLELLKTVADQAAANLLTLRLTDRLQQAKEMEAFQVMSAFFMHDLKNLASRLSLVTQNLPVHFDNPDFRNDALRTISQSLDKINGMCNRLSLLSQKLELQFTEVDLNELVKNVLAGLDSLLKAKPVADLNPLPKLILDPEQIQKVLTNLLLNANEAIRNGEGIQVSTGQQGNLAVFSVTDNGCGMSKEFINRFLFRPFQTTKKQGMGIGLFHSKQIIEAHQGRIEVESEEGKGSKASFAL